MSKEFKKQTIQNLINKGEVFAAEVAAYDWHLHSYFLSIGAEK